MSSERGLIYVALIGFFQIHGVMSSCMDDTSVARMCHNSTVVGTHVFIDVDASSSTTLSSLVACTCIVTAQGVKQMEVKSNFIGTNSQCGTTMEYTGQGIPGGNLSHSCNDATFNVTTQTNMNITVGVRKDQPPYLTQYCVSLEWQSCGAGMFQCNDGGCIPYASICNSDPDCKDESDEDNGSCGVGGICIEGLALCESGKGCRPQGGRCNNITECKDGSDEIGCDTLSGNSTTETPPNPSNTTTPLITVTCTESEYMPQTTTTTIPQTTTAPTVTTTSTTTTVAHTTTNSPTTTPLYKTTSPETTTYKITTASPSTTFSPTTFSETQQTIPVSTTIIQTTTPIQSTANSVSSESPPTTSARSSTAMDISTSTERTDYSKPAPDPMPPWLIAVIVCVCLLVILAVVVAVICQLTSKCDKYWIKRGQRNYIA
ncbi:mucin-2-like isoform X2 [Dreissena polymorpha]|uniref:mucin-2-like isoform X2 n=1 Tax=Dreissena polymorpha TaxID=45954 RepID=UPI002263FCE8|nr:mucin-2-like isoform X2 [Dreissena polymorpha]